MSIFMYGKKTSISSNKQTIFLYTEKCIKTKACRVVKFNKNKHPIIKLDNMEIQQ